MAEENYKLFDGSKEKFFAAFLNGSKLSAKEVKNLKDMVEKLKQLEAQDENCSGVQLNIYPFYRDNSHCTSCDDTGDSGTQNSQNPAWPTAEPWEKPGIP